MYKEDLALNNFQWLICHKTKPNQAKLNKNTYLSYLLKKIPAIFFALFTKKKYWLIGQVDSVRQWSGRPGFNPNHIKEFKNGTWYLLR